MTASNVIHCDKFKTAIGTGANCRLASSCILGDICKDKAAGCAGGPVNSRVVRDGEYLFRAGDEFSAVYLVRSGVIKTSVVSSCGQEQVIGFHSQGDFIGLDAVDRGRQVCDAVALDAASVCTISFAQLCELASRSPSTCERLMRGVSRNVERSEHLLMTLGHMGAMQRIATFLRDYAERQEALGQPGNEFVLPMSRSDIGHYLGMAIETVSRQLTRLRTARIIAVDGTLISILDRDALEQAASDEASHAAAA